MAEHHRQTSPSAEVSRYLNVDNAKIIAFLMTAAFIMYHGIIHMKYGSDSCKWLLSDGRFQGYNAWQPYGCMMHKYSMTDSRNCMQYISYWGGRNHIAFVGDSRIRQLYYQFVRKFSKEKVEEVESFSDLHYTVDKFNLKVDFLWHPMVNESMYNVYKSWLKLTPKDRPNFVVTGSATWSIKLNNASMEAYDNFKANLTYIIPYFNKLKNTTKILWMLQDPVIESRLSANCSMISNSQIDFYNKAALELLMYHDVTMWSSGRLISQGYNKDSPDGLHLGPVATEWDVQILMNMYCNDHMNFNDGTCCSSAEPVTVIQIITAVLFGVCFVLALCMSLWRRRTFPRVNKNGVKTRTASHGGEPGGVLAGAGGGSGDGVGVRGSGGGGVMSATEHLESNGEWVYEVVTALARLGVIMVYFFLCDRTYFFMKENKYYTHVNFFLPFSYLMILGFFFTENTDRTAILHRDQTDEWKGWMQIIILIYHLTGASQVLQIYMQIRVLVTSYLFLSGYGHFCYFWNKGDYSFVRFCTVMFRMNFLVVMLCFVMNRPYQFYYFVPLVSFWFVIMYCTMAIWPHITSATSEVNPLHYLYMILKFAVLVVAITLLYASEVFFEKMFLVHPIKALFVTSDDSIREWRFRWTLDRYSSVYGMGFAFGLLVSKKFKLIDDSRNEALFSKGISWLLALLAVCGLLAYGVFASFCRNKQECNEVHPYISFLPIVSYIVLRNLPGWLRTKYSTFFAWFGKFSLELFIGQYHIWLAADTHGLLVLVPNFPVLNVILISFIFVCAAHEIHTLTAVLTKYIVPADWKILLRNIVCFIAILLPIALTHGMLGI